MKSRLALFSAVAGAVLALAAISPVANASCSPAIPFGQVTPYAYDIFYGYHYVFMGSDAMTDYGSIVGRFWQPGQRGLHDEGPCDDSIWLVPYPPRGGDAFYMNGALGGDLGRGSCVNNGCPSDEMILLLQTKTVDGTGAKFAVGRVTQQPGAATDYNYNRTDDDWLLVPIPRPRVISSSRSGTNVILDIQFDNVAMAYHENVGPVANPATPETTVDEYRLMRFTGTADPGRNPASWTLHATAANAGGATLTGVSVDCSNTAQDVFLATQLSFDNGQLLSDYVSASVRIECDPNLAEPKFKLIDKKRKSPTGSGPRSRN